MYEWNEMTEIERNILIAQKVFDWSDADKYYSEVPCYTTDIAVTWEVIDKLRQSNFSPTINGAEWTESANCGDVPSSYWHANFTKHDDGLVIENNSTYASTASEAICLAALKTVGVDIE